MQQCLLPLCAPASAPPMHPSHSFASSAVASLIPRRIMHHAAHRDPAPKDMTMSATHSWTSPRSQIQPPNQKFWDSSQALRASARLTFLLQRLQVIVPMLLILVLRLRSLRTLAPIAQNQCVCENWAAMPDSSPSLRPSTSPTVPSCGPRGAASMQTPPLSSPSSRRGRRGGAAWPTTELSSPEHAGALELPSCGAQPAWSTLAWFAPGRARWRCWGAKSRKRHRGIIVVRHLRFFFVKLS